MQGSFAWKEAAVVLGLAVLLGGCTHFERQPDPEALLRALQQREVTAAIEMLDKGADIYAPVPQEYRGQAVVAPVALALLLSYDDPVRARMYECGFDPNRPLVLRTPAGEEVGEVYPVAAAARVRTEILEELLVRGGRIEEAFTPEGDTALTAAVSDGIFGTARRLLEQGADANRPTQDGRMPLWCALGMNSEERKSPAITRLLMLHGADPYVLGENGNTAIHLAIEHAASVELAAMLPFCTELDVQNGDGNAPLHIAAKKARLDALHALMAAGADPRVKNNKGYNAKDEAVRARQTATIIRMIEHYGEEFR